jgi:hypothetical protein
MRRQGLGYSLVGAAAAQLVLVDAAPAYPDRVSGIVSANPIVSVHPFTVVAIYGEVEPSVLCAAAASTAAAQQTSTVQETAPEAGQQPAAATEPAKPGCVLPIGDSIAATTTPPAESEIAPLLALGPLLATAAAAGTAAAIASSSEGGDSPESPD